jgi:hypothetical protein
MARLSRILGRSQMKLEAEAEALEDEHGPAAAILLLRNRIAHADRAARRRLYRLHDEIARRHDLVRLGLIRAS